MNDNNDNCYDCIAYWNRVLYQYTVVAFLGLYYDREFFGNVLAWSVQLTNLQCTLAGGLLPSPREEAETWRRDQIQAGMTLMSLKEDNWLLILITQYHWDNWLCLKFNCLCDSLLGGGLVLSVSGETPVTPLLPFVHFSPPRTNRFV